MCGFGRPEARTSNGQPPTMKNDGMKNRAKSATLHYIGIVSVVVPSSGGRLFYL